jgi:hypothetical protein
MMMRLKNPKNLNKRKKSSKEENKKIIIESGIQLLTKTGTTWLKLKIQIKKVKRSQNSLKNLKIRNQDLRELFKCKILISSNLRTD